MSNGGAGEKRCCRRGNSSMSGMECMTEVKKILTFMKLTVKNNTHFFYNLSCTQRILLCTDLFRWKWKGDEDLTI